MNTTTNVLKGKPSGIPQPKKKKFTNKELEAIYDVKVKSWRYNGLKGIMWHVTSLYVRQRDFKVWNARCISCNKVLLDWQDGDAGHYVPVHKGGFGLLFDTQNINLQCKACNNSSWTPHAGIPYGIELDRRYGAGTAEALWVRRTAITKEWSPQEYDARIRHLQGELILLQ